MAGHSQFKNIMHRKGAQDAKRAKMFTKLGREIITAVRAGGADPAMNPRLRLAIQKARGSNMPNDRIKKSIDTAIGGKDGSNFEEVRYEGFAPGGVAVIMDALTDNRNRTVSELRTILSKHGGNLGESGTVSFLFDRVGAIYYPAAKGSAEAMFEAAIEAGADNCASDADRHEFTCQPEEFASVREVLVAKFGEPEEGSGLIWKPNTFVDVNEDQAATIMKLIDVLEDNDDVQSVTTNFSVSDAVMKKLMAS